jgi:hypothetical protein
MINFIDKDHSKHCQSLIARRQGLGKVRNIIFFVGTKGSGAAVWDIRKICVFACSFYITSIPGKGAFPDAPGVRGQGVREQGNSTGVLNILGVRPVSRILCMHTTYHIVMYSHNIHIRACPYEKNFDPSFQVLKCSS